MKVKTETNVYEPFEEFVQQVGVKPLDDAMMYLLTLRMRRMLM